MMSVNSSHIFPQILQYIDSLDESTISPTRRERLQQIIQYGKTMRTIDRPLRIQFICTHNSRRSQMAQVWAKTTAQHFGIELDSFSGGTETTEFHPGARQALKQAGFRIIARKNDPAVHEVFYSDQHDSMHCHSKRFDHPDQPNDCFLAVMTCTEADEQCPVVPGADKRILLPYDDPGQFDNRPGEKDRYEACSRRIATEMMYVMSRISN